MAWAVLKLFAVLCIGLSAIPAYGFGKWQAILVLRNSSTPGRVILHALATAAAAIVLIIVIWFVGGSGLVPGSIVLLAPVLTYLLAYLMHGADVEAAKRES